ncbi:E3 ubiquitin-protein ligase TRIM21 [Danio rerio]|uniref:Bloodthirsty-related gene family, member 1 n=1 Tax=Danio rerio TaxID=7955 RepID=F1QYX5_DANRE|nr:E3 ubiquitin-protein ligase TRIM21 [Danio rerio]|eukprot:XP_691507.2 E3 ubiquitin-protein ligase TRIM21 [Danio rerio]
MSFPGEFLSEEQFTCSICLDIFTNPVSTPCGHSFCSSCISSYWEGQGKTCFCPLCKESFRKRPELHVNHTLKEITEQFKRMAETTVSVPKTATTDSPPNPFSAQKPGVQQRPVELPKGLFQEMKTRMQRSSSTSSSNEPLASGDPQSLPNVKMPRRNFSVTAAGSNGPQCPNHGYSLELLCKTDLMCICAVCAESEHYGHTVTEAKREMNIRKSQLRILEVELQGLITVRERKIEEIQTSLAEIQVNAEREKAGTISMFAELMKSVEKSQAELLEVVEMGQRAAELRSQAFIREVQTEISDLKNRCSTINQLTQSQDHLTFFKTFSAHTSLPVMKSWAEVALTPDPTAGVVLRNVSQMVEEVRQGLRRLSEICLHPSTERSLGVYQQSVWRAPGFAMDVTLDKDSAHPRLVISEDGKQVLCSDRYQNVPDTLERFDRVVCVLGRQGINSGCHYWEVLVSDKTDWDLGIAARTINRKGKIAANPANGFWFLSLRDKQDYVFRTEPSTPIIVNPKPQRITVSVDYERGQLSFYNADTKTLIFTYTDSFSETLYPFFSPCTNKSGKNEAPLIICPPFVADPSWLE